MAENIRDFGGVEGDDSNSAMSTNVDAINDASVAASDNTVYLPEGTWYIGLPDRWGGMVLRPGHDATDRGAAGLGFVGDGPDKTTLRYGYIEQERGNFIRYEDNVDHGDVLWRDLTYDGNYQAFDFSDEDTVQAGVNALASLNATVENVRFENHQQAGWRLRGGTFSFDRCTFRNIGIGRLNQTGDSFSHPIAQGGADVTVTNCEFGLIPGSCVDCSTGGGGDVHLENVYARSVGVNLVKLNDADSVTLKKINHTGQTQALLDAQEDSNATEYRGRWFFRRQSGTDGSPVPVTMSNIYATELSRGAMRFANDMDVNLNGGQDGPVLFERTALNANYDQGFQVYESTIDFDFGTLAVYDSGGSVFDAPAAVGTINELRRGDSDGLGEIGDLSIASDRQGADPPSPTVPSQTEVGVNSTNESAPTVSWVSPSEADSVSSTITLQLDGSDQEDDVGSLSVDYRVDGGTWSQAVFNSDSGYYEANWDTTTVADGSHTLEARATDSAGQTATATIDVTTDNDGPLFEEWTPQWDSERTDWDLVNGSSFDGGYALAFNPEETTTDRHAIAWDNVGTPSDVEVLDRFRVSESFQDENWSANARIHIRSEANPSDGANWNNGENGYFIDIGHLEEESEPAFRIGKYVDGEFAVLDRFGAPQEDVFYYRRFRAEGTELKAKAWPMDEGEPDKWDVTLTDSELSEGWVGLGSYRPELTETDVFSVATGGASAEYAGLETYPTLSWARPSNGDVASETITLQLDGSDQEDDVGSLSVDYRVDGGTWSQAVFNSDSGYYEANWDTTTVADGSHTLEARATDSAGQTATATIDVTTENNPTIERFETADTSGSAKTSFEIDWDVSDRGGDLDRVVTTLKYQDVTVAADSTTVSGSTASGTHTPSVRGDVDEIRLSVNDTTNRVTTDSKTV